MKTSPAIAVIVFACGHPDAPPVVSGQAPRSSTHAARVPVGWSEIDPPSDERRHCANYSEDEWQVAVDGDDMRFTRATTPYEPDTGPAISFEPKRDERGRRHVVAVGDGFIAGYDGGEWGGALYWVAKDGATHTELAQENVRGVLALDSDHAIALEGLAHITLNEGAVRWLERSATGWRTQHVSKLDGVPQTFVAAPDAIYTLTLDSLVRISRDGTVAVVQPLATPSLYPSTMAVDAAGQLWLGMRQLVLRLTPTGGTYKPQWFVEDRCRKVTVVNLSCRCDG